MGLLEVELALAPRPPEEDLGATDGSILGVDHHALDGAAPAGHLDQVFAARLEADPVLAGRLGGLEVEGHAERVLYRGPRQLDSSRRVRGEGAFLTRGKQPPAALEPDEELSVAGALEGQDEAILGAGDGLPGSALLRGLAPRRAGGALGRRRGVGEGRRPPVPGRVGLRFWTGVGPGPETRPRSQHEGRGRRDEGCGELAAPDQRGHRPQPGFASAGLLAVERLSQPGQAAPQP